MLLKTLTIKFKFFSTTTKKKFNVVSFWNYIFCRYSVYLFYLYTRNTDFTVYLWVVCNFSPVSCDWRICCCTSAEEWDPPLSSVLGMTLNHRMVRSLIAITPWSSLTRSGSSSQGPIYGQIELCPEEVAMLTIFIILIITWKHNTSTHILLTCTVSRKKGCTIHWLRLCRR